MAPCLSVNRSRESRPAQRRKLINARSEFAGSLSYSRRSVAYSADPGNPPDLGLALARETTMKNIRQNLLLAFGYNFFAIRSPRARCIRRWAGAPAPRND